MTDDYKRQYAAAVEPPPTPHPDYAPNGIAPRLGHALLRLTTDPSLEPTSHMVGVGRNILVHGLHGNLPIFADVLEDAAHPALDWFDWRHADRGIAIDKALFAQIAGKRRRRANGGTEPVSPGWIMADWKERKHGRVPRAKALAEVRKVVPDATHEDLAHSIVRLHDIQHGVVPNLEHEERYIQQARDQHLRDIATLPHDIRPHSLRIDTANIKYLTAGRQMPYDALNALRVALDEGRVPIINPHRYPDTRR